jgi:DNA primase
MAKTYLNQAKYIIRQSFEIKGVVDKHDIIGAIFGQSEGLIGEDLDIRELQSAGKIGRIELELASEKGVTKGTLTIPSGADMVETAILASTVEVVDKVGPCDAYFKTDVIEDTRGSKRKQIVNRAKELLSNILNEEIPDSTEITNEVRSDIQTSKVVAYGNDKLPAGPSIDESEEVILVEGRADVLNLLKYNIKNVIAIGGSKIPPSIVELTKRKTTIAFLDGDRGGVLDLKKLLQIAEIDFIARAPMGLEVEELTKKQILAALNKRIPVAQTKSAEELDLSEKYWEANDDDLFSTLDIEVHEKNLDDDKKANPISNFVQQTHQSTYQRPNYHNNNNTGNSNYHGNKPNYHDNRRPDTRYQNNTTNRYPKYEPKAEYKPDIKQELKEQNIIAEEINDIIATPTTHVKPEVVEVKQEVKKDFTPKQTTFKSAVKQENDLFKEYPFDVKKNMTELKNTFSARFFDKDGKLTEESKVKDILKQVKDQKNGVYLLFDGVITKRLVELSKSRGILAVIGSRKGKMDKIKGIEAIEYEA